MTDRFEFEVDTTKANEYWQDEVEENLRRKAKDRRGAAETDDVAPTRHAAPDGVLRPHQRRDAGGPASLHPARLTEVACLDCLARSR